MTTKVAKTKLVPIAAVSEKTPSWNDPAIEFCPTCMVVHRDITLEQGEKHLHDLAGVVKSSPWWVGDLLNYLEVKFGDKYTQAVDMGEWEYSTLKNFCWVCKGIPPDRRHPELTFYQHLEVMRLQEVDQDRVLANAVKNLSSIREIRAEVQKLLPAHAQTDDKWMSFKDWWENYESSIDADVAIIAQEHAKAAWEAALAKGIKQADE